MKLPERPDVGLVLCYAYLWAEEDDAGRQEGSKDRPAVIVLARQDLGSSALVYVAPITHSPSRHPSEKIAVPAAVKRRLGLDSTASWISAVELNVFVWPGPDLRPIRRARNRKDEVPCFYGFLPQSLFKELKRTLHTNWVANRVLAVKR